MREFIEFTKAIVQFALLGIASGTITLLIILGVAKWFLYLGRLLLQYWG